MALAWCYYSDNNETNVQLVKVWDTVFGKNQTGTLRALLRTRKNIKQKLPLLSPRGYVKKSLRQTLAVWWSLLIRYYCWIRAVTAVTPCFEVFCDSSGGTAIRSAIYTPSVSSQILMSVVKSPISQSGCVVLYLENLKYQIYRQFLLLLRDDSGWSLSEWCQVRDIFAQVAPFNDVGIVLKRQGVSFCFAAFEIKDPPVPLALCFGQFSSFGLRCLNIQCPAFANPLNRLGMSPRSRMFL